MPFMACAASFQPVAASHVYSIHVLRRQFPTLPMLLQSDRVASDAIAEIKVVEAWTQSLQARCISCIPTLQDKTDLLFNGGRCSASSNFSIIFNRKRTRLKWPSISLSCLSC